MKIDLDNHRDNTNNNPFRVPEGYFGNFARCMEQRIKDEEQGHGAAIRPLKRSRRRIWLWAASIALLLVGTWTFVSIVPDDNSSAIAIAGDAANISDEDYTLDEIVDYAMLDNQDLYSYITEE